MDFRNFVDYVAEQIPASMRLSTPWKTVATSRVDLRQANTANLREAHARIYANIINPSAKCVPLCIREISALIVGERKLSSAVSDCLASNGILIPAASLPTDDLKK